MKWIVCGFIFGVCGMGLGVGCVASTASKPQASAPGASKAESVWVSRPDGQKQCESGGAEPVEAGMGDLKAAGVEVLEAKKRDDGAMRIQMCGAPQGSENAYRIRVTDLEKARALGFKDSGSSKDSK